MPKMIFVNLPVRDLEKARAFYEAIGSSNNPQFSDDTAACMVLSDTIHVMLLTHAKWSSFTKKPISDARKASEVMLALSADSRDAVNSMTNAAGKAGGLADVNPPQDHGFMFGRSFEDRMATFGKSCGWMRARSHQSDGRKEMSHDTKKDDSRAVQAVLESWAKATRENRKDEVLKNHEPDLVTFDVLAPLRYDSAEAYRKSWGDWQPETQSEGQFDLEDMVIEVSGDLSTAHGLIRCGGTMPDGTVFQDLVRATFCLRKRAGAWRVFHQHISKPLKV